MKRKFLLNSSSRGKDKISLISFLEKPAEFNNFMLTKNRKAKNSQMKEHKWQIVREKSFH